MAVSKPEPARSVMVVLDPQWVGPTEIATHWRCGEQSDGWRWCG